MSEGNETWAKPGQRMFIAGQKETGYHIQEAVVLDLGTGKEFLVSMGNGHKARVPARDLSFTLEGAALDTIRRARDEIRYLEAQLEEANIKRENDWGR